MNADSKILGIPLVLIFFIVVNALVVIVPVALMQNVVVKEIIGLQKAQILTNKTMVKLIPTPTVVPTATPAAVLRLAPTKAVVSPATKSGTIR